MRTHVATVTQRGQVTIPAAVRRLLRLAPRDRIVFEVGDDGSVRLAVAGFTLDTAFGSVQPIQQPADLDEQARIAKEDKAQRSAAELAGS